MEETITITAAPVTTERPLEDLLRDLAQQRQRAEAAKLVQETILEEAMKADTYKLAGIARNDAQARIEALTAQIKARAVRDFDGNKHPIVGVQIKIKASVSIIDPEAARKYALEEAPAYVNIDMEGLAKLAKKLYGTPHALAFACVINQPTAEITSNLDTYLKQPEAETGDGIPF